MGSILFPSWRPSPFNHTNGIILVDDIQLTSTDHVIGACTGSTMQYRTEGAASRDHFISQLLWHDIGSPSTNLHRDESGRRSGRSWTQSPIEDIAVVSEGRLSRRTVTFRVLTGILETPTSSKITPSMKVASEVFQAPFLFLPRCFAISPAL